MNKIITTAFAAASLLVGSAFAAQTAGKMDAKTPAATTDAKTTVVKKHHHKNKKHNKSAVAVAPAAVAAPAK